VRKSSNPNPPTPLPLLFKEGGITTGIASLPADEVGSHKANINKGYKKRKITEKKAKPQTEERRK